MTRNDSPLQCFTDRLMGLDSVPFLKSRYRHDHLDKDESGVLGKMPSCKSEVEKMFH